MHLTLVGKVQETPKKKKPINGMQRRSSSEGNEKWSVKLFNSIKRAEDSKTLRTIFVLFLISFYCCALMLAESFSQANCVLLLATVILKRLCPVSPKVQTAGRWGVGDGVSSSLFLWMKERHAKFVGGKWTSFQFAVNKWKKFEVMTARKKVRKY